MSTPRDIDPATLRFVAELADTTARGCRRLEANCRERKLPGEPMYYGKAASLESLARCLRNRATRAARRRLGVANAGTR